MRACVWVQGCPIHCPGCAVPHTWPMQGGTPVEIATLGAQILDGPPVEGVTFLGGEPFAQAEALAALGRMLQLAGMGVLTFTGYSLEQIRQSSRPGWQELLAVTDLLIDGPYQEQRHDLTRPWVGSSNQRYHFLTSRYHAAVTALLAATAPPNRIEVRIEQDGRVTVNGMVAPGDMHSLFDGIAADESHRGRQVQG